MIIFLKKSVIEPLYNVLHDISNLTSQNILCYKICTYRKKNQLNFKPETNHFIPYLNGKSPKCAPWICLFRSLSHLYVFSHWSHLKIFSWKCDSTCLRIISLYVKVRGQWAHLNRLIFSWEYAWDTRVLWKRNALPHV